MWGGWGVKGSCARGEFVFATSVRLHHVVNTLAGLWSVLATAHERLAPASAVSESRRIRHDCLCGFNLDVMHNIISASSVELAFARDQWLAFARDHLLLIALH